MKTSEKETSSWLDTPLSNYLPRWNIETLVVIVILALTIFTRFYHLDLRVMSHDEVNHVVPSWDLYRGNGYRHDPVTHGPLQFHLIALSFFMLGDNDFSARVPAALFSVAAVAFVLLAFRRYLGRPGALIAGFLFLISPFLMFYGRYTRNEALIELFFVLTIYGILRYLEKGDRFSLYLLTVATVLHFTAKETAYIYTAQALLFVGVLFLGGVSRLRWPNAVARDRFILLMGVALVLLGVALGTAVWNATLTKGAADSAQATQAPVGATPSLPMIGEVAAVGLALAVALIALVVLVRNLGWQVIRAQRPFHILILIGTLVLPLLSAFPVKMVGMDPLDYSSTGLVGTAVFVVLFSAIAVAVGMWWQPRLWLENAALFYGIFTVFYTTFFTNGQGFFTGLVGSLGYWLSQQGVERGSQPWYYFALIQVPVYEFLAALGTLLALYFGIRHRLFATVPGFSLAAQPPDSGESEEAALISGQAGLMKSVEEVAAPPARVPVLALLVYWSLTSLVAYSIAGEKMPWLTVHIAMPLLLAAGWGLGYLVETAPWKKILGRNGVLMVLLGLVWLTSLAGLFGSLLGNQPPFKGNTTAQLQATATFIFSVVGVLASSAGLLRLAMNRWKSVEVLRLVGVVFFGVLAVLTARAAIMASFINYDYATEYLVYAHAAPGPKQVLAQVEEISRRMTRGLDIQVAYDNDALYPYWWYLRNYPNHRWYTDQPTRDLQDYPLIIAGEATFGKLKPIVKDNYIDFEYIRLWWPNQDYFNLTWDRLWGAIRDPQMRTAIFDIWLNRDYTLYGQIANNPAVKVEDWQPSSRMHFYVRKDVVNQIWEYGVAPVAAAAELQDPYQNALQPLTPDLVVGMTGSEDGRFQAPRGVAVAPDGSLYVADSKNHRIQHFSAQGEFLNAWGSFADVAQGEAPGGTFNEPWGVAVGPDGSVYVADTWNHRVQKFTAEGKFVTMWGYFGQAETPDAFWGPRDVAVDGQGRVYVTDTGNKRVVVFSPDGVFISQFGSAGMDPGQFDEPVGVALDQQGNVYVVDTWNQRIQVLAPNANLSSFTPVRNWEIYGWFGQSLENKPYIAVDASGNVYVTDPEAARLLVFDSQGNFLRGWNDEAASTEPLNVLSGVEVDDEGQVWVSNAVNNTVVRFKAP